MGKEQKNHAQSVGKDCGKCVIQKEKNGLSVFCVGIEKRNEAYKKSS